MCLLWSMWYSANLSQWVAVLGKAGDATTAQVIAVLGVLAAGVALGTVAQYLLHRGWRFGVGDKAGWLPALPRRSPCRWRWSSRFSAMDSARRKRGEGRGRRGGRRVAAGQKRAGHRVAVAK
ncbi:MAG: hypothetical protein R3F11_19455 [Verrucomicrobiales bacterium]